MVGEERFERSTSSSRTMRSAKLSHTPPVVGLEYRITDGVSIPYFQPSLVLVSKDRGGRSIVRLGLTSPEPEPPLSMDLCTTGAVKRRTMWSTDQLSHSQLPNEAEAKRFVMAYSLCVAGRAAIVSSAMGWVRILHLVVTLSVRCRAQPCVALPRAALRSRAARKKTTLSVRCVAMRCLASPRRAQPGLAKDWLRARDSNPSLTLQRRTSYR